jgi:hypothetical protein
MKTTRRRIMQASLGAGQLALLGAAGFRSRRVHAGGAGDHPTRLLTIYARGGWMPELFFSPLDAAGIAAKIPAPTEYLGEPTFFTAADVRNIDGSGDAPDADDPSYQRIRVPHLWDEAALAAGGLDPQNGATSPLGYSWRHGDLFKRASIIHGIDVGTAAHDSGQVSMFCGLAGPKFRSPALHAWVAEAFAKEFPERPLPSVSVGQGPIAYPVSLGPSATPTRIASAASLEATLSERSDLAWNGLRDRADHPQFAFDSRPMLEPIATNAVDEHVLARSRRLFGTVNAGTDAFYEDFYETYSTVSKQLALDLVTSLEQTPGWESFVPTWAVPENGPPPYGVKFGYANGSDTGSGWSEQFGLALKLFKADLCSAISLRVSGVEDFDFDTHDGALGPARQFLQVRALLEVVGRFMHEMAATPAGNGKSLLDDTLVLVFSEFSRTWPGTACDHWPATSVLMCGGGIVGNRQVGNFDLDVASYSPLGSSIPLVDEGGDEVTRMPRSADIIYTSLKVLGVEDFFIPGGPAEIIGVRP